MGDAEVQKALEKLARTLDAQRIPYAIIGAMALNEFFRRSVRPLIVALQIAPPIAWLPLAVIWFGLSERAVVFVAIVGAFPSVLAASFPSRTSQSLT